MLFFYLNLKYQIKFLREIYPDFGFPLSKLGNTEAIYFGYTEVIKKIITPLNERKIFEILIEGFASDEDIIKILDLFSVYLLTEEDILTLIREKERFLLLNHILFSFFNEVYLGKERRKLESKLGLNQDEENLKYYLQKEDFDNIILLPCSREKYFSLKNTILSCCNLEILRYLFESKKICIEIRDLTFRNYKYHEIFTYLLSLYNFKSSSELNTILNEITFFDNLVLFKKYYNDEIIINNNSIEEMIKMKRENILIYLLEKNKIKLSENNILLAFKFNNKKLLEVYFAKGNKFPSKLNSNIFVDDISLLKFIPEEHYESIVTSKLDVYKHLLLSNNLKQENILVYSLIKCKPEIINYINDRKNIFNEEDHYFLKNSNSILLIDTLNKYYLDELEFYKLLKEDIPEANLIKFFQEKNIKIEVIPESIKIIIKKDYFELFKFIIEKNYILQDKDFLFAIKERKNRFLKIFLQKFSLKENFIKELINQNYDRLVYEIILHSKLQIKDKILNHLILKRKFFLLKDIIKRKKYSFDLEKFYFDIINTNERKDILDLISRTKK